MSCKIPGLWYTFDQMFYGELPCFLWGWGGVSGVEGVVGVE